MDQVHNFSSSAMNVTNNMKNNPNSNYDQINSKFNKKIGKSKAHTRLTQKLTRNTQTNKNQMKISFSVFQENSKMKITEQHLIDGYNFELLSEFKLWLPRNAIQAMDAWFESLQMQIQESPLLTFQELENRKIENMDKMKKMNIMTPWSTKNQ